MPSEAYLALMILFPIAAVVIGLSAWRIESEGRAAFLREVALVLGAFTFYFVVRARTEGDVPTAMANAIAIMDLQDSLGLFVEPALQEAVVAYGWLVAFLNWIYTWGHWPVIGALAIWLFRSNRGDYRLFRNAFLISGGISLLCFWLYPVAPPRLVEPGMTDTLMEYSTSFKVLQPAALVNQYAAMPSLHFGWNLLVAIAIMRQLRGRHALLRSAPLILPVLMLSSIVLTANHYWLDAVAGGIVSVAGLAISQRLPARERILRKVPRPAWLPTPAAWVPSRSTVTSRARQWAFPDRLPEAAWHVEPTSMGMARFLD
jgi:hypothetical protein